MESGQLIKYNKSNIFLEKYYKNYSKEASPRLFYENQNWTYLWINSRL